MRIKQEIFESRSRKSEPLSNLFRSNQAAKNAPNDLDAFKSYSYCVKPTADYFQIDSEVSIEYGEREGHENKAYEQKRNLMTETAHLSVHDNNVLGINLNQANQNKRNKIIVPSLITRQDTIEGDNRQLMKSVSYQRMFKKPDSQTTLDTQNRKVRINKRKNIRNDLNWPQSLSPGYFTPIW